VRAYSNKVYCRQFTVSRTTTLCSSRRERHAHHSRHCRLPAFQCAWVRWMRKLATEQSRSKSCGLFSVDSVVADGVTLQNFRHWSVIRSLILGSAKPGHSEPNDLSAAKKTEDGYHGTWTLSALEVLRNVLHKFKTYSLKGSCWILSGLTISVRDRPCFTVFRTKLTRYCQIQCNFGGINDLCKIGKEYLTAVAWKLCI